MDLVPRTSLMGRDLLFPIDRLFDLIWAQRQHTQIDAGAVTSEKLGVRITIPPLSSLPLPVSIQRPAPLWASSFHNGDEAAHTSEPPVPSPESLACFGAKV